MHSRKVIHRDLKPDNILLGKTDSFWKAVIADFGNSATVQQTQAASGACAAASGANSVARWTGSGRALSRNVCTLWYAAPEMLVPGESYGYPVDVWSLGFVLVEVEWGHAVCPTKGDSCNTNAEQLQAFWDFCLPSPKTSCFVLAHRKSYLLRSQRRDHDAQRAATHSKVLARSMAGDSASLRFVLYSLTLK